MEWRDKIDKCFDISLCYLLFYIKKLIHSHDMNSFDLNMDFWILVALEKNIAKVAQKIDVITIYSIFKILQEMK